MVRLSPDKINRLLQNALQERTEKELPLNAPEVIKKAMNKETDHMSDVSSDTKMKPSPMGGEGMDQNYLSLCIKLYW